MSIETFEAISLNVGLTVLISYMFFIMYRLAKDSGAGRFGSLVIFGALGLGVLGFVIKEVLVHTLDI
jgi:hypothetical protein